MQFGYGRGRLLSGAAIGVVCGFGLFGMSGEARADSICTYDTVAGTYSCVDADTAATASGTFTVGATPSGPSTLGLKLTSGSPLSVTMSGAINQSALVGPVVVSAPGAPLTYTSTGTATYSGLQPLTPATTLTADSIIASTGTNISTGGFGVITIASNGDNTTTAGTTLVSGGGSIGIDARATNGNNVVNTGVIGSTTAPGVGAVFGVVASTFTGATVCGTNTVNVTGNITVSQTGVLTNSCGASTVNVQGGRIVTTLGTLGATIQNNATTVATTTINGNVTAASPSALALDANGTSSVTVINSPGVLTGTFDGTAGVDTFTINAGGTWTTGGTSDFGAGADILTNAGTINAAGGTTFAGLETFANSGALVLGAGTFALPASTAFTNSGTIRAEAGATTITSLAPLANSGTIDLQDGAAGDVLTINSAFAGSGGSNLDVDFTGTASDRLVITGAASGTTTIDAAYLGGGFNLDGLLVVDAGSSTANAFVLGTVTGETPLLDVSLVQSGADYFLVAAPTEAAFNPLVVPGFATDLWYQSADEIFAETVKPATTVGFSFWGEGYYSRDKSGEDDDSVFIDGVEFDVDNELKTKRHGLQLGVDYGFAGARIGLTGGYGWAKANGNAGADVRAKGWNLGLYGQFGGLTGFHGEVLAKHDRYDAEFDNGAFDGEDFDIRSTGFDGSFGYRFGMGGEGNVDIHAGLSHVRTKVDDIGAFGFDYDIGKLTSTRGRLGARATFGGGGFAPYIDGTVYREFDGDGEVGLFDGLTTHDLDTEGKGTWVRLEAGLNGNDGPGPILAAFGDLGDRTGFGIRAGWRLGGAAAVAAPPPPPPPVVASPPPPATQTCPDGSVILATDACPPPPPPPPPAAGERG